MKRHATLAFEIVVLVLALLAVSPSLVSVPRIHKDARHFNAIRAKARLANILGDQRPHPVDSTADDVVRARLVATLRKMGLAPVVRDQFACNAFRKAALLACARVRNVIAAIGPQRGKALLLSAHYDSVPVGPGAADDGIGVATLLEIASRLKQAPPSRPVLLLFNEGEELGLVGARAFLADPLSLSVDTLLNFDARGVNGPVTMFETSDPNGAAIAAYKDAVTRPLASSLASDLGRLIPNDTDVTVFKPRGWLTLNSAIVGNETRYHSAGDDLSALDTRSLEDMGDEATGLTMRLSRPPLAQPARGVSEHRIFFDIAQRWFIDLPLAIGVVWLLLLLACSSLAAFTSGGMLAGTALILSAIAGACGSGWLAASAMASVRAGTYWRAHPALTYFAICATVLATELAFFSIVFRKLGTRAVRAAYWLVFALIGTLGALVAPGAIIYFLIPPTLFLAGLICCRRYPPAATIGAIAAVVFLSITWGELLIELEELFSPGPLWMVAPVAALLIAPALVEGRTLFARAPQHLLVGGGFVVALAAWVLAGTAEAYSPDHQQRFTIEHVTQFPERESSWSILNDGTALPATFRGGMAWRRGKLDFSDRQRWLANSPAIRGLQPPIVSMLESNFDGNGRTVKVRIAAHGAERILLIAAPGTKLRSAGVPGFMSPPNDSRVPAKFTISCSGRSCDGSEFTIRFQDRSACEFTIVGSRNGLPAFAGSLIRGRPPFARAQYIPDETVTVSHVSL